jgi:putative peptide maturation dehydrogenase
VKVRRCSILHLEPRERVEFNLAGLLAGSDGLVRRQHWVALAPHLCHEVDIDEAECTLLGRISPEAWTEAAAFSGDMRSLLHSLLLKGLVIARHRRHAAFRQQDEALRAGYWHPLAATFHAFTRWDDADAVQAMQETGTTTAAELRQQLGPPPSEAISRVEESEQVMLPTETDNALDRLLARRVTCRNFDTARPLPLALLSQLLGRVFGVRATERVTDDTVFLKKSSPSGGGLHPVEAYLLIRNVQGLADGAYHYQPMAHALEPLPGLTKPVAALMLDALAQQHWFADAQVLVALAPRYARNFWKYRHHAKAYRAVVLEAGHLSQTLYLSATDAGLGAYVTCAINEGLLEQAFGLDPMKEGVLAVCGFGWRSSEMVTMELDPTEQIWRAPGVDA